MSNPSLRSPSPAARKRQGGYFTSTSAGFERIPSSNSPSLLPSEMAQRTSFANRLHVDAHPQLRGASSLVSMRTEVVLSSLPRDTQGSPIFGEYRLQLFGASIRDCSSPFVPSSPTPAANMGRSMPILSLTRMAHHRVPSEHLPATFNPTLANQVRNIYHGFPFRVPSMASTMYPEYMSSDPEPHSNRSISVPLKQGRYFSLPSELAATPDQAPLPSKRSAGHELSIYNLSEAKKQKRQFLVFRDEPEVLEDSANTNEVAQNATNTGLDSSPTIPEDVQLMHRLREIGLATTDSEESVQTTEGASHNTDSRRTSQNSNTSQEDVDFVAEQGNLEVKETGDPHSPAESKQVLQLRAYSALPVDLQDLVNDEAGELLPNHPGLAPGMTWEGLEEYESSDDGEDEDEYDEDGFLAERQPLVRGLLKQKSAVPEKSRDEYDKDGFLIDDGYSSEVTGDHSSTHLPSETREEPVEEYDKDGFLIDTQPCPRALPAIPQEDRSASPLPGTDEEDDETVLDLPLQPTPYRKLDLSKILGAPSTSPSPVSDDAEYDADGFLIDTPCPRNLPVITLVGSPSPLPISESDGESLLHFPLRAIPRPAVDYHGIQSPSASSLPVSGDDNLTVLHYPLRAVSLSKLFASSVSYQDDDFGAPETTPGHASAGPSTDANTFNPQFVRITGTLQPAGKSIGAPRTPIERMIISSSQEFGYLNSPPTTVRRTYKFAAHLERPKTPGPQQRSASSIIAELNDEIDMCFADFMPHDDLMPTLRESPKSIVEPPRLVIESPKLVIDTPATVKPVPVEEPQAIGDHNENTGEEQVVVAKRGLRNKLKEKMRRLKGKLHF